MLSDSLKLCEEAAGLYNVFFTALPPLAMGLFDKTCSAEMMLKYPKLYKPSQSGQLFNVRVFWVWIINGMVHSAALFWLTLFICQQDILWANGRDGGYLAMGLFVYTYVVVTVCYKAGMVMNTWTWPTHCAIWGSIFLWFIFITIYSNFYPTIPVGNVMTGMYIMVFSSAVFWLGLLLIPTVTVTSDFVFKVLFPSKCSSGVFVPRLSRPAPVRIHPPNKCAFFTCSCTNNILFPSEYVVTDRWSLYSEHYGYTLV